MRGMRALEPVMTVGKVKDVAFMLWAAHTLNLYHGTQCPISPFNCLSVQQNGAIEKWC